MQTCSRCNAQSNDSAILCTGCQCDLREFSTTAVALQKMRDNPRVKYVRISVGNDACPACHADQGTYPKEDVPPLPHPACSHENGCRCFYEPFLDKLYP